MGAVLFVGFLHCSWSLGPRKTHTFAYQPWKYTTLVTACSFGLIQLVFVNCPGLVVEPDLTPRIMSLAVWGFEHQPLLPPPCSLSSRRACVSWWVGSLEAALARNGGCSVPSIQGEPRMGQLFKQFSLSHLLFLSLVFMDTD